MLATPRLLVLVAASLAAPALAQTPSPSSLSRAALGPLEVTRAPDTGAATFVRGRIATGLTRARLDAAPELEALAFLGEHAAALGMPEAIDQLLPLEDRTVVDELDMTHVRFGQHLDGIPVYGAQVLVHFAPDASVSSVNGDFVPGLAVSTRPGIGERRAFAIARSIEPTGTLSGTPELVVYTRHVDPAVDEDHLAWLVRLEDLSVPSRRLYVVDAHAGVVLRTRQELHTALDRRVFDAMGTGTGTLVRSEGEGPVGDADVDALYDFLGVAYGYYLGRHSRDSFNGAGAPILGVANWDGPNANDCPNAFWNGQAVWFCTGAATDDIVAHELTHAVTQFTAGLIYQNESGALNEAYSDIFGELIDLDTTYGDGSASPWAMGEGSSLGVIRSLSNPPAHGDPDRGTSYLCTTFDNGGVHTNSGIANKAAFLIADGGSFNGHTVTGLGRIAASELHYRALTAYLTPTSGYLANYNALLQACDDLHGAGTECDDVLEALLATEMDAVESCPGSCPLQLAVRSVGEGNPPRGAGLLGTLYALRAQVLGGTPYGRRLIDLYYRHAGTVSGLLAEDERLRAQVVTLVDRLAEGVATIGVEDAGDVRVSAHTAALFASVLRSLEEADPGSELAEDIRRERAHLAPEALVGRTFAEAWSAVNLRAASGD